MKSQSMVEGHDLHIHRADIDAELNHNRCIISQQADGNKLDGLNRQQQTVSENDTLD